MTLYRLISIFIFPFLALYILFRVVKGKEDKNRFKERFAISTQKRPEGQVILIHAVSVGEANSAMILIEELLKFSSNTSVLITTTTVTSAAIIEKKIPAFHGRLIHQYLPLDSYFIVKDFFNFWKIRAAIFVESEIWPNMIYEARKRGIASFLVNARISKKSFEKWHLAKNFGFNIFDYFTAIFVQMKEDVESFSKLVKQEVLFYGNLKSQAHSLAINEEELEKLKAQIGNRKIFLAASTHKGEEEVIIAAHKKLKKDFPDLLTIIVLRHPNRASEVKMLLDGLEFVQRSKNQTLKDSTEIYLVDTLGELGIFYSLTNFTFLGGSLLEIGGHNPFEPIKLGCAVIVGRGTFNFKEIYEKLEKENACTIANSADEIYLAAKKLLQNEEVVKAMSNKALEVIENSDNIAKKIVTKIDQILLLRV